MKFDDLDKKMRVYEQSIDQTVLPDLYIVARLDGRNFSRLTKEICEFEAPFDEKFRDMMINTVKQLMNCGFRVIYGYTESDEISLLFHKDENTFGRKVRKYNSILAGMASATFSLELGQPVSFDCRIAPLPNIELVKDYFLWRQEDAHRNALNAHCYWMLRKEGKSIEEATSLLEGKSVSYKNELLFSRGINFDKLPLWQKRGVGIYWGEIEKAGYNPIKNIEEKAIRRDLKVDMNLELGEKYGSLIEKLLGEDKK
ncbi:MAG: guanylyltransferase [Clostridia bacterium]|nr:guanylyltransferase [Clostridia bacterium]